MASLLPYSGALGSRLAKHLLRRATYNVTKSRITQYSTLNVDQALTALLTLPAKNMEQPISYSTGLPWINDDPDGLGVKTDAGFGAQKMNSSLAGWWMDEAKRDTSLRSKMTYFLLNDFTASIRTLSSNHHYDYIKLLEFFCLGDWKEFCFQMSRNNVMLKYLNNDENTDANPNENFAREILELFTIGKGPQVAVGDYTNYTEADVEEAARALTGWTYSKNSRSEHSTGPSFGNLPCGYAQTGKHDFGAKQFSSRFNNYVIPAYDTSGKTDEEKLAKIEAELKEFIAMVLDQDETAKFICRKMYRFFVSRNITTEIENDIIVPLAATFRTNYDLEATITQLLKSQHFYDADDSDNSDEIIGGLIKSPLDLILQTLSITNYPVPDPFTDTESHYKNFYGFEIINEFLVKSGQDPFRPPSVAGFPPTYEAPDFDKFWFNSSTIITRYNMASILANKNSTKVYDWYVSTFVKNNVSNPENPTTLVSELVAIMFPEAVSTDRLNYFVNVILLDNGSLDASMWADDWTDYVNNPSNTTAVEAALKPLFEALTWSQEYQNN
jgi:uncharacterized protein (DUF1800 family)